MILSQNMIIHPAVALIGALSIFVVPSHSSSDTLNNPFHVSWKIANQSRYDIVFSIKSPLKNVINLESLAANSTIEKSLLSCTGYNACLLQDGNFVIAYNINSTEVQDSSSLRFTNVKPQNNTRCPNEIRLFNHCSTHWNPPVHISGDNCHHTIDWHSPYSCHSNATNYEHPCYTYDSTGNLIDLTPWVLSNGSSYSVDTGAFNKTVRQFTLNVCNDAHETCGPNVAACYFDGNNSVESGYNNLTSIKYDDKDKTVLLTSLGQHDDRCTGKRVKTVVRFVCKNKIVLHPKPRLIRNDPCESIIEWQTIHACPFSEISAPATKCAIKYDPLNIDINLRQLTGNQSLVEVNDIMLNGKRKTMVLGLCRGIPKTKIACGGKESSTTAACLVEADRKQNVTSSTKSEVVSHITKSNIRLVDSRLYLESYSPDKTCQVPMGRNFNATNRAGARIEFFCSQENYDKPRFIGIEECIYVFEWGSQSMCLESLGAFSKNQSPPHNTTIAMKPSTSTSVNISKPSDSSLKIDLSEPKKPSHEVHRENVEEAKKVMETTVIDRSKVVKEKDQVSKMEGNKSKSSASSTTAPPVLKEAKQEVAPNNNRMDKLHKFFMIGLIVMSLAAFIVVIIILDKKTQLRLPLSNIRRHARQAFQPPPVPYTRVDQFNDLDL